MAYFEEFTEGDKDTEKEFIDIFIKQSEESVQVLSKNYVDAQEMIVALADDRSKNFKEINVAFGEVA